MGVLQGLAVDPTPEENATAKRLSSEFLETPEGDLGGFFYVRWVSDNDLQ
jgi:hypothetical protein